VVYANGEREPMKTDIYTKVVLTVIALALIGNLLKPVLTPSTVQAAGEGKFDHVQIVQGAVGLFFFDSKTSDLWHYGGISKETQILRFRLVELGQPIQQTQ
jgi:hypothetical protein